MKHCKSAPKKPRVGWPNEINEARTEHDRNTPSTTSSTFTSPRKSSSQRRVSHASRAEPAAAAAAVVVALSLRVVPSHFGFVISQGLCKIHSNNAATRVAVSRLGCVTADVQLISSPDNSKRSCLLHRLITPSRPQRWSWTSSSQRHSPRPPQSCIHSSKHSTTSTRESV